MKNTNITFLAPYGATFSHDAYTALARIYRTPEAVETSYVPAATNGDVLNKIREHRGFGCIAMETLAEGRVVEPLESFIDLLAVYSDISEYPFRIVGSIRMKLHFCLMTRSEIAESGITRIVAHKKALGACRNNIEKMAIPTESASSNGEAARLIAEDETYATSAALGPKSAAEKYELSILNDRFEGSEAITTFFLMAPANHPIATGKENRALIVFKIRHQPGSLVDALLPFKEQCLDMIQIHSVHAGNGSYHFAIEIEISRGKLGAFEQAMQTFRKHVVAHVCFGPFEVLPA